MKLLHFPLYNFVNGTFIIIIFALVCIGLIIALAMLVSSGSKDKNSKEINNNITETNKENSVE